MAAEVVIRFPRALAAIHVDGPYHHISTTERREVEAWYDSQLDAEAIERLRPHDPFTRAIYRVREWRARP